VTTILIDFPENGYGTSSAGGGATTLDGVTAISGGGTPDTSCGMLYRPFRLNLITA